jgi:hypothetical protein
MKNNTKRSDQINGEWATNVGALATVVIKQRWCYSRISRSL